MSSMKNVWANIIIISFILLGLSLFIIVPILIAYCMMYGMRFIPHVELYNYSFSSMVYRGIICLLLLAGYSSVLDLFFSLSFFTEVKEKSSRWIFILWEYVFYLLGSTLFAFVYVIGSRDLKADNLGTLYLGIYIFIWLILIANGLDWVIKICKKYDRKMRESNKKKQ